MFETNQRGRPRLYCCKSHRQRVYEKRRLAKLRSDRIPLKLLAADMKARQRERASLERVVHQVLSKALPRTFPPTQSPRPSLRVIEGRTPGVDKPGND